jgi:guanosine-3',5'-bis(diphosphate) 3'-pyrophosphohydrolase
LTQNAPFAIIHTAKQENNMEDFTMEQSGIDVVRKAQVYAMAAHAAVGQKRKYTGEPYIVHPAEVAKIVAGVPGSTPDMVAAAWLHDVVEDTGCTYTDIHMAFGADIAALVGWLTDVSKPEDGNRAHRKALDRAHTAKAPAEAQTIKLADLISNSRSIIQHDPAFAKTYLEEKRLLLEVMTRGNVGLHAEASGYVGA